MELPNPEKEKRVKCLGVLCELKILCKKYWVQNPDVTYRRINEDLTRKCKSFEP